jgi:hypothetical protein
VRAARARPDNSPARTRRWALLIAQRYGLTLAEARAELRRCAANGFQTWEFYAAFANDCKDIDG